MNTTVIVNNEKLHVHEVICASFWHGSYQARVTPSTTRTQWIEVTSLLLIVSNTVNSEIFARVYFLETSHMRSFVKLNTSRNGKITLLFTDISFLCPSREFLMSQICFLMPLAKIKFSRKFPNLQ